MGFNWSPTPGEDFGELFEVQETATNLSYHISAIPVENEFRSITAYWYSISPAPADGVLVMTTTMAQLGLVPGIYLEAKNLDGLIPPKRMTYENETGGALVSINSWRDLPVEADELVSYVPYSDHVFEFDFTAFARLDDGSAIDQLYKLRIIRDWTPGRNRLKLEVDARRKSYVD